MCMTNISQFEKLEIDNNKIETVAEYKYFGQTIYWKMGPKRS